MSNLKTNYKDAELSPSMNGKRQYELQYNEAGYTNLVDKTAYTEVGDTFGADDINATNSAVNELNQNLTDLVKKVSIVGTTNNSGNYIITSDIKEYVDNGYVPIAYLNKSTASGITGVQGVIWKHTTGDWYVKIYTSTGGVSTAYFDGYIYLIKVS